MKDQKNLNQVFIMELLSARFFHDIAGSIGAIANSVEFLKEEDEAMRSQSISLLDESSDDLMSKFKLLRQAYSFSDSNMSIADTKINIAGYLARKKIALSWDLSHVYIENSADIERINKIISNIVIICVSSMLEGHLISIKIENKLDISDFIVVKIHGEARKVAIEPSALEIFARSYSGLLNTKNIQAYFLMMFINISI